MSIPTTSARLNSKEDGKAWAGCVFTIWRFMRVTGTMTNSRGMGDTFCIPVNTMRENSKIVIDMDKASS